MTTTEYGRITDYLPHRNGGEERVEFREILDQDILIENYDLYEGDYGAYARVVAQWGERKVSFITGSRVLMDQLSRVDGKLPLWGRIVKQGNYYTFA
jgi:hypothetical protein